jgi:glutaredoxin
MTATTPPSPVEVLWRPGCPFCARLRTGLRRAGIETVERNIWTDLRAAARVRAVTGGDDTVPTVVVGARGLVNPSVSEVVSAVRAEFPDEADALVGSGAERPGGSGLAGISLTIVVALLWVALTLWRPSTTWHLAPVLVAGAWPWLLWQARPSSGSRGVVPIVAAAALGFVAAGLTTAALAGADLLRGPTLPGFTSVATEALVLAGGTAVLAALLALLRARRTPASAA